MAAKRLRKIMKRFRVEEMADRLSEMPESVQLLILSCLDARHAVQTSALSKTWVSSWSCIPVLNFRSYGFKEIYGFDKFVDKVLSCRQSVKLDKLTFKQGGICNGKTLEKVFDYAFLHSVKELEANIERTTITMEEWPIRSSDSLTSLKLESFLLMGCSFLEARSVGSFKNLTNLHLTGVEFTDPDPFSRFPALEKLKLVCCFPRTGGSLNVYAPLLSEFTFFYHILDAYCCEFRTPKLRYFEWGGSGFPRLTTRGGGLPVLDTAVICYNGFYLHKEEENKIRFDDMLMLFDTLCSARALTVSAPMVHLLTFFPDELVNRSSPFQDIKCLKLDFSFFCNRTSLRIGPCRLLLSETLELVPGVKAYLLQKSHEAECSVIKNKSPCSTSHTSQKCVCNTTTQMPGPNRSKRMLNKPTQYLD